MAPGAIEREHQEGVGAFAKGLRADELFELACDARVTAELQFERRISSRARQAVPPRAARSAAERTPRSANSASGGPLQSASASSRSSTAAAGLEPREIPPLRTQTLEPIDVELGRSELEPVAGAVGDKHSVWLATLDLGFEDLPELEDVPLQRVARRFGRMLAPELVDQDLATEPSSRGGGAGSPARPAVSGHPTATRAPRAPLRPARGGGIPWLRPTLVRFVPVSKRRRRGCPQSGRAGRAEDAKEPKMRKATLTTIAARFAATVAVVLALGAVAGTAAPSAAAAATAAPFRASLTASTTATSPLDRAEISPGTSTRPTSSWAA